MQGIGITFTVKVLGIGFTFTVKMQGIGITFTVKVQSTGAGAYAASATATPLLALRT